MRLLTITHMCCLGMVANEACTLAVHWGLGKLIAFYDDNTSPLIVTTQRLLLQKMLLIVLRLLMVLELVHKIRVIW
ncbi:unnamed protein product [Musa textilis]